MPTKEQSTDYTQLHNDVQKLLSDGAVSVQIPVENPPGYGYPPDDVRRAILKRARKSNKLLESQIVSGEETDTIVFVRRG